MTWRRWARALPAPLAAAALATACASPPWFQVTVVDDQTGRGVPLVELRAANDARYYTDSNGVAAILEPDLYGRDVRFRVTSHGYEFPGSAGGEPGCVLTLTPGGSAVLTIRRLNIAERLYRITGEGIYRDSLLLGRSAPHAVTPPAGLVLGQDSVLAVPWRGRIWWFWGDTLGPAGFNGGSSCATSGLPGGGAPGGAEHAGGAGGDAGLDPSEGIRLEYLVDAAGFSRPMLDTTTPGLKWLYWAAALPDGQGGERLIARYRAKGRHWQTFEGGIVAFDETRGRFEPLASFPVDQDRFERQVPMHPFRVTTGGTEYLYFAQPYPDMRVKAALDAVTDPSAYEFWTCLPEGGRYDKAASRLDRAPDGRLRCGWKRHTPPLGDDEQKELIDAGAMRPDERSLQLRDIVTDAPVKAHAGSVAWNAWRRRWIMLVEQDGGCVDNGEIWFAEADTPVGPWVYAAKIVTHERYTFYNPVHHPFFDQDGGRLIYFEGTYTDTFSGNNDRTPRYNYNQIMYRLALDDPRLSLPAPVYRMRDGRLLQRDAVEAQRLWPEVEAIPFFALPPDRPGAGGVAVAGAGFGALPRAEGTDLSGVWKCRADLPGRDTYDLQMRLDQKGERIEGRADTAVITEGSLRSGQLILQLSDGADRYSVRAGADDGKISGDLTEAEKPGAGRLVCDRATRAASSSPALVALYESRDAAGRPRYSLERHGERDRAAGRVWRNPSSILALDPDARPAPARP